MDFKIFPLSHSEITTKSWYKPTISAHIRCRTTLRNYKLKMILFNCTTLQQSYTNEK